MFSCVLYIRKELPDKINNGYAHPRRRKEALRTIRFKLLATISALELIVLSVEVTQPQQCFEAPSAAYHPLVAISKTDTTHVSLAAELFTKPGQRNAANIESSAKKMHAEEVTVETFAKLVTSFGLNEEMFQFTVAGESPQVIIHGEVKRPTGSQANLRTQI